MKLEMGVQTRLMPFHTPFFGPPCKFHSFHPLRYHPQMPIDMKALARTGAEARIRELQGEMADIQRAFPDLRGGAARRFEVRRGRPAQTESAPATPVRRRKRPAMTAAQRMAVGVRMKKYWAERRKQSAKK